MVNSNSTFRVMAAPWHDSGLAVAFVVKNCSCFFCRLVSCWNCCFCGLVAFVRILDLDMVRNSFSKQTLVVGVLTVLAKGP